MPEFVHALLDWFRPLRLFRWLAVVVACLVLWVLVNLAPLGNYLTTRERLEVYRETTLRLEREREELLLEHEQLLAGGFPLEKAARERHLLKRPGEKVFFIERQ